MSVSSRQHHLQALRQNPEVTILIIGGGINGIGLFRELALQGIDVLLTEKSDFCAGASAASTRVIHGGLRYLENGEFRLVKEALYERNQLLKNAPHYVHPLPTTIPIYSWLKGLRHAATNFLGFKSRPGDRGAAVIKIGLSLYDYFSGIQSGLPGHQFRSRLEALQKRPAINRDIVATATYYDARITYPERLCIELLTDTEQAAHIATALNYMRVVQATGGDVTLCDELTQETVTVQPQIVVNATGAWIDFTNEALSRPTNFIGGTKGSHIVVDHPALHAATQGEMLYFSNSDGRICIFYPFYDKVIIGATDLPVDNPDEAICDADEVRYLMDSIRAVFPDIHLDESHIVYQFCGVRPLPRSSALTAGQISRDHHCEITPATDDIRFPIYSLIGGKWTTFRAFAEQVTDKLLASLGKVRLTDTHNLAIGGGKDYPVANPDQWIADLSHQSGLGAERCAQLLERYGTQALDIAEYCHGGEDKPLSHVTGYSKRELEFLISREYVCHLDDLLLRRTLMGLLGQINLPALQELAGIAAAVLNWSNQEMSGEINRTLAILRKQNGIHLTHDQTAIHM